MTAGAFLGTLVGALFAVADCIAMFPIAGMSIDKAELVFRTARSIMVLAPLFLVAGLVAGAFLWALNRVLPALCRFALWLLPAVWVMAFFAYGMVWRAHYSRWILNYGPRCAKPDFSLATQE